MSWTKEQLELKQRAIKLGFIEEHFNKQLDAMMVGLTIGFQNHLQSYLNKLSEMEEADNITTHERNDFFSKHTNAIGFMSEIVSDYMFDKGYDMQQLVKNKQEKENILLVATLIYELLLELDKHRIRNSL
ncbi:MAG: hypothetical protein WBL44_01310 [Nitrososphaeraceae archaeon]